MLYSALIQKVLYHQIYHSMIWLSINRGKVKNIIAKLIIDSFLIILSIHYFPILIPITSKINCTVIIKNLFPLLLPLMLIYYDFHIISLHLYRVF